MKPFKNCFATNIDFSLVGYKHALEETVKNKFLPNTLFISSKKPVRQRDKTPKQWAEFVLEYIGVGDSLKVVEVDDYRLSQWSLGTEDDYGYGSLGTD